MAFQESGVRLSVQNLSGFLSDISRADQAAANFGKGGGSVDLGGQIAGSLGVVEAKFGALNSFAAGIFAGMGSALAGALLSGIESAATAIPRLFSQAINEAADFQQSFADAFAILQLPDDVKKQVVDLTFEVGANPNLSIGLNEANQLAGTLAIKGVDVNQILNGVLTSATQLQNAVGGGFDQIGTTASKTLALFGHDAQQFAGDVNTIVGTIRSGGIQSINDYNLALANSGALAAQMGVPFADFNTILAASVKNYSSGADAGTGLKTFLLSLSPTTKPAISAMKTLGLSFYDLQGNLKPLPDIAQQLNSALEGTITSTVAVGGATAEQQKQIKSLGKTYSSINAQIFKYENGITGVSLTEEKRAKKVAELRQELQNTETALTGVTGSVGATSTITKQWQATQEQRFKLFKEIFNTDAIRTALALGDIGATGFEDLNKQIANTDAAAIAAEKTDTLRAKLKALGDAVQIAGIKFGAPFLDGFKSAVEGTIDLVNVFQPGLERLGITLANRLAPAFDLVTGFIKNAVTQISNFTTGFSQTLRLSNLLQFDPGGFDISLTKDIFGGTKLNLSFSDLFSLDLTSNKFDLKIGDIINFSGSKGEDGFKLNLNDYFTVDTTDNKIRVNVGDLISFDTGSLGQNFFARLQLGSLISTFIRQAGKASLSIGDLIDFNTSIDSLGQTLTQLRIGQRVASIFTSGGKVTVNLDKLLFFDFNPSNALGFATLNFSALGKNLVDGFYGQGKFKLDIGRLLSIGGSFSPGGVFTLSLNDKNFKVDFGAIQTFVAGIPGKIQQTVTRALADPAQFVVDASTYLAGLGTALQTSVTTFFTTPPAWVIDASTYLAGLGTALQTSVTTFFTTPPAWVIDASAYLAGLGTALQTSVTTFFTTPPAWVVDASAYLSGIKTAIQEEINRQLNTPGTFANTAQGAATGVSQGASQAVSNAIVNTAAFVESIKTSITTSLQNAFSLDGLFDFQLDARDIASRAGQAIGRFLGNAISGSIDFISLDTFSSFGASFGRFMHSGLLKALAGATVVLGGISNTVADVFLNFFGGIGEGFGGTKAFAKLGAAATAISNSFVTAVENESKALGEKINKPISDFLAGAYNGIINATQGFADSLIGIANQIIGILNAVNPLSPIPKIETFAGQNQRAQSALTSNAARQAADNASTVAPAPPAPLSTAPALGSLAQFNQPSTAPLKAAIDKAAASYDAMSAAALTNSKNVSGAKAPKYDVLSSAITTTATSLKAPASKPPSYSPLSSAISSGASKINSVQSAPSYNPLTGAISGASAKLSSQPNPPSYNPLTGAINNASSKLNSMGQPTQFGPLTAAANSAAAKLAGFTVPSIPPFPGWGALVGDVGSPPSNNTGGGGNKPSSNTGGGNNAKSVDLSGGKGGFTPIDNQPQRPSPGPKPIGDQPQKPLGGFDDTRIVSQLITSTNQIIKALEDNISRASGNTRKTSVTNLFAIGSSNTVSTSDLLNSVLQSDQLRNMISASVKGNLPPAAASSPSTGGSNISPITWPGRGGFDFSNPFGASASGASVNASSLRSGFAAKNVAGSQQVQNLLVAPPQVVNNYYNTTKNYNLSVQTVQSDASVIEQFGYMERLAASV